MSEQNVQIVADMYGAFARGDVPSVLAVLDPKVEWWAAENFIYDAGNPYIGPESVLHNVFMRIGSDWDGFASIPAEILDAGDTVVSHGYYSGIYRKNGKHARAQFAHFFTFREGKIVRFQQYTDTAQFRQLFG